MADSHPATDPAAAASGPDRAAAGVEKLHLDEVTGEMISKTELKKRQKAREKEAKKKEKQPAAAPTAKKANAEADEKELTPNQVRTETGWRW